MIKDATTVTDADKARLGEMVHLLQPHRDPLRARVCEMTDWLRRARVVSAAKVSSDVITMNTRFRAWDLDSGVSETFTLVYHRSRNDYDGAIPVLSAMGIRALGSRLGDVIDVPGRGGVRRFRIERILYQPEAAGDFCL